MKAFEVHVNGERVGLAGVGRNGDLWVILSWVGGSPPRSRKGFDLQIGGLNSTSGESLEWEAPGVGVGDEISIKLHEASHIDPSCKRTPTGGLSAESLAEVARSLEDRLAQTYQRLIEKFPDSAQAKVATKKLSILRNEPPPKLGRPG